MESKRTGGAATNRQGRLRGRRGVQVRPELVLVVSLLTHFGTEMTVVLGLPPENRFKPINDTMLIYNRQYDVKKDSGIAKQSRQCRRRITKYMLCGEYPSKAR